MKQINYLFATIAMIIATTFSASSQSNKQLLTEFAKGLDDGFKMEMDKPEWKGLMTKAECVYDGYDIVVTTEYTYTLQNTTQENIDIIKDNLSAENLKILQVRSFSTILDQNPQIKEWLINIMRSSNCCIVYDIDYHFINDTQHITLRLTPDDLSGNTISKDDLITMILENYRKAVSMEIGKNGVVDSKVEYDGSNLVMTYVLDYDKEVIDELPAVGIREGFISEVKSNPVLLSEMRQLKINNIDLILVYIGKNGGAKTVHIDSNQF